MKLPWVVQSLSINNEGDCWSLHLKKDAILIHFGHPGIPASLIFMQTRESWNIWNVVLL